MSDHSARIMIATGIAAVLLIIHDGARAADAASYPDWKGQWVRFIVRNSRPGVTRSDKTGWFWTAAPLTPEYQAVLEKSLKDQAAGGLGNFPTALCFRPACRT